MPGGFPGLSNGQIDQLIAAINTAQKVIWLPTLGSIAYVDALDLKAALEALKATAG